jgi:hypothetical protein
MENARRKKAKGGARPAVHARLECFIDLAQFAILLDVDGTILDVAATPQSVVVPASLVRTLGELHARPAGRSSAAGLSKISTICSCRSGCLVSADTASNRALQAVPPCRGGMPS